MASLSQFIGTRKTKFPVFDKQTTAARAQLSDVNGLTGIVKTYTSLNAEDPDQLPTEEKRPSNTSQNIIKRLISDATAMIDLDLSVDVGNLNNTTNVVVDGQIMLEDVPVVFLLQLKKRLQELNSIMSVALTLDSTKAWRFDSDLNLWKTDPVETVRAKVRKVAVTKAVATDKHAAQAELIDESVVVGKFNTTYFAGSLTQTTKQEVIDRINKYLEAVQAAINSANSEQPADHVAKIGPSLNWIFEAVLVGRKPSSALV